MPDRQLAAFTLMIAEPRNDGDSEDKLAAIHPEASQAVLDRLSASTTCRRPLCGIPARPIRSTP